ncbi:hypothetical protein Tco_0383157 [Tanacetum coccineum]
MKKTRYAVSGKVDMAYWAGFLGVRATQKGYAVLGIGQTRFLVKSWRGYAVSLLLDTAYWLFNEVEYWIPHQCISLYGSASLGISGSINDVARLLVKLIKRKLMEFEVGDKVMLKVSPWKGVVRFGKRGKLNPRFVRPFKVIKMVGYVAYKLELPEELSRVHNTFHVSNLKKCHADEPLAVPLDGLHFDDKLQFVEEPIEITDREVKRLKRSRIPLVKVRWNSKRGPEFTWEREDQFQKKYPHLFSKTGPSSSAAS